MSEILELERIDEADAPIVGGKGLSLGRLARHGLPVPSGYCITASAYQRLRGRTPADDPHLARQIIAAYHALGAGPVAVRSSATDEDGQLASMAGLQDTILGVRGDDDLLAAVERCWNSLTSERARAYRRRHGVTDDEAAMAVVVQRLVAAEVAGVLFTRDPFDSSGRRMLVEASWGLGETIVSGKVTPDRFHLDRETGEVVERTIHDKAVQRTEAGDAPVPEERRRVACLDDEQLRALAELGREVEAYFGDARDVEWAWAEGRFWLLQARAITTATAVEREQVRQAEIAALRARAEPGGTAWSRYNLAEILPEPTPMTWSVVRRLMSVRGGVGLMYRDLGFAPDPTLGDEGDLDLVCGRPYFNLSRQPRMVDFRLPFEHPIEQLKARPNLALYPQPKFSRRKAGLGFWIKLPWLTIQLTLAAVRRQRLAQELPARLRAEVFPTFAREIAAAYAGDLDKLDPPALRVELERWIERTLVVFARDSLKPTALAAIALDSLERQLARTLGRDRARSAVVELIMGVRPDPDADPAHGLRELAEGRLERSEFLRRFGHRGGQEMELSRPRWAEDDTELDHLACRDAPTATPQAVDPWPAIADEAKLAGPMRSMLEAELRRLRELLALRETAKHYFMMGYAWLRRLLLALDRRHQLRGGIWFLTLDELASLERGQSLATIIAERKRRRAIALSLEVPAILFSDDLEAIGRPATVQDATTLVGTPLSAGVAEAEAWVLESPEGAIPRASGYVLVCPSTDPGWVPLFGQAKALVMETGGVLSHGAIVAREYGLPAVAGLPDVVRRIRTGQRLRVDGNSGQVSVLS
jgi:pyruvate,water dikinase